MSGILTAIIGCASSSSWRRALCLSGPPRRSHNRSGRIGCRFVCLADSLARSKMGSLPWTRRDLNPRPPRCKRGALPTELRARTGVRTRNGRFRLHETVFVGLAIDEPNRDRIVPGRPAGPRCLLTPKTLLTEWYENIGGDPSAGSPTDTLLRLNPACRIEVQTRQEACLHYDPTRMV